MKKVFALILSLGCLMALTGCQGVSADYPAAIMVEDQLYYKPAQPSSIEEGLEVIMVDDQLYLKPDHPSPGEVAPEAVIGTTTSYTDEMPDKEGETNFDRELGCPYARVKEGIAVLYNNEWYICTPME